MLWSIEAVSAGKRVQSGGQGFGRPGGQRLCRAHAARFGCTAVQAKPSGVVMREPAEAGRVPGLA